MASESLTPMPDDITYGRVTGSVTEFIADVTSDGKPDRRVVSGTVTFRPSVNFVVDTKSGAVIYTNPDPVEIKPDGTIDVQLVATDAPHLNPTKWFYKVEIKAPGRLPIETIMTVPGGQTKRLGDLIDPTKAVNSGATVVEGGKGDKGDPGPRGPMGPASSEGYQVITEALGDLQASVTTAATYAIDLAGDAKLTVLGENGQTIALDVVTNGKKLTVVDGPEISSDGLYAMLRSRDEWKGGSSGGSVATGPVGTLPSAPKSNVVASIDFSESEGKPVKGLTLSNGKEITADASVAVKDGLALFAPEAKEGWKSAQITIPASLKRLKMVMPYDFGLAEGSDAMAFVLTGNGSGLVEWSMSGDHSWSASIGSTNFKAAITESDESAFIPTKGVLTMTFDARTATQRVYINDALVTTLVYESGESVGYNPDTFTTSSLLVYGRGSGDLHKTGIGPKISIEAF